MDWTKPKRTSQPMDHGPVLHQPCPNYVGISDVNYGSPLHSIPGQILK